MPLFAATKNAGKLRELETLFAAHGVRLQAFERYVDPPEGATSYEDNAAAKARALFAQLAAAGIRGAVVGDDSGFEVAALGWRPGPLSARYGPPNATWAMRRQTLLAEFAATGSTDRRARFVCALHCVDEAGREYAVRREADGLLAVSERGESGFSYDPIFEWPAQHRTFAEMSEEEKNAVSHRAQAVAALFTGAAGAALRATEATEAVTGKLPAGGT